MQFAECGFAEELMKSRLKLILVALIAGVGFALIPPAAQAQTSRRPTRAIICGNPKLACKTTVSFEANDLPFHVPQNAVIIDTELFYAVILKSLTAAEDDCKVFVPETERLAAQGLFPDHKVFTSRCADPGEESAGMLYYTNVDGKYRVMAVYAGATAAQANRFLAAVKATGQFPGAYIKRMRAGFNGT
jgi:hypothetical protein